MVKPGEILKDTNFYPEARKFREGLEVKNIANRKQVKSNFRSCNDTMMINLQIPLSRIYVLNKGLFWELIQKNIYFCIK